MTQTITGQAMSITDLLASALGATGRGWYVFPLAPNSKYPALHAEDDCPRTGPCTNGHNGWQQRATTDPDILRRAWAHGPYGIGVATGPSRLVVIDLDTAKHPGDLPPEQWAGRGITDGYDVFAALCEDHGQPGDYDTYTVRTGRGGRHLYFTAPPGLPLRNTTGDRGNGLGWKVDTRADGGYVVAAGSTVNGRPYTIVRDVPPMPLPGWLAVLLTPKAPPVARLDTAEIRARIGRLTAYTQAAVRGEAQKVEAAGEGVRNHTLFASAAALGRLVAAGTLPEGDATDALLAAGQKAGLGEAECRRTIAKGLTRGGNHAGRAA
ncbi:bifunctional DNA primase/polymerase [Kitasatospora sp. NPDC088346]|uniref:bifunctional DNA primase/polymerase n=1 Tax=Kitasatospora sp. NPDC088346 TaxID=3364073 RepID=UPI0038216A5A